MQVKKVIASILGLILLGFTQSATGQQQDTVSLYDLSIDELMNLRVQSATKKEEPISNIPASIVIITRQEIQSQGWTTLEEVLSNIPGMYQINDYLWFGSDNYGVRGFFSSGSFSTMTVMVNGVSQKEDWYNSFPLTKINVPVEAIDRIEVIRGPMSVVYGSNAFLGAINIITNQDSNSSQGSAGIGSNGYYKMFGRIAGEREKVRYTFNASMTGAGGIDQPYSKMTDNIDPSWNLPSNPSSSGQLKDYRKYFGVSMAIGELIFEFAQTTTNRGVIDYYPGYDNGHNAEIESAYSYFSYTKSFGESLTANFKTGYSAFRNRLGYKHNSDTTSYGFNDIFSKSADGEVHISYNKPKFTASAGLTYHMVFQDKLVVDAPNLSNDYINLDAGIDESKFKHTWAIYSQVNYDFSHKVSALVGFRVEQTPAYIMSYAVRFNPSDPSQYLSRTGTYEYGNPYLIPRVALIYHLTDKHHVKLMYGIATKDASVGENMDIVRYPDRPQLKPASMQTFEVNYTGAVTKSTMLNLSVFHNRVNNLISRTNQIENGVMRLFNTNSGRLRTIGLEASANINIQPRFTSTISAVYQHSTNMQKGYEDIDLEYAPSMLLYTTLAYRLQKNIQIGLSGYYVGKQYTYWKPDSRDANNPLDQRNPIQLIRDGSRIGESAPAHFVMSANVRLSQILGTNAYCSVYVYNLANTEIRYPTTRSNDIFEKGTLGYGRYASFTLGYRF
ncbi:MAG: TonB-dependent receptor [Bacteroidales bacterium]|nr:TonB-dependent receptor [Bacteroidales bacterium]MBN2750750.1 TonB-dependent receptor [Bacteroidales bacterium]